MNEQVRQLIEENERLREEIKRLKEMIE